MIAGLITASLGLASFSLGGLYCNHADLSPRYAPVLLGLTNTSGALPGIIGVAVTGGGWLSACVFASVWRIERESEWMEAWPGDGLLSRAER